jgi:hypothetical protein
MYKLLFIDEEKDVLDDFADYVDEFPLKVKVEVITRLPSENIDAMIDMIMQIAPDALITDFRLNEMKGDIQYNVPYNGVDLVEKFQSIRQQFPCFVLTALDDEAVGQSDDVNIVYIKNILYNKEEGNAKAKFLDRVVIQIEHHQKKISDAQEELLQLIKVRESGKADYGVENRIMELDDFIEKSIDAQSSIPVEFKTFSNTERLDNILSKVDELLKKIDKK